MQHPHRLFLPLTAILAWAATALPLALGHPFHISLAEAEWNPQSARVEVSLKLHAVDFERAVSRQAGRKLRVEDQDFDAWAVRYLDANFFLCDVPPQSDPASEDASTGPRRAARSSATLVGHELDGNWLWLYFELRLPEERPVDWIVHTVLIDVLHDQINTLAIRQAGSKRALRMTAKTPARRLPSDWPAGDLRASGGE